MTIKKGDTIKVDYEGKLENGEVFDSSTRDGISQPLEFEVGSGNIIPGFDNGVVGMKEGQEKEITIKPEDAYGEINLNLKQKIPRNALQVEKEPQVGMMLGFRAPDGRTVPLKITAIDKEFITVDLNHPLAGKKLIFKIKILSITSK